MKKRLIVKSRDDKYVVYTVKCVFMPPPLLMAPKALCCPSRVRVRACLRLSMMLFPRYLHVVCIVGFSPNVCRLGLR